MPDRNLNKIGYRIHMTLFDGSANAIHALDYTMAKSFYPCRLIIKRISGSLNDIPTVIIKPMDRPGMFHPFEVFYDYRIQMGVSAFLNKVRKRNRVKYFASSGTRSINCYTQNAGGISFDYEKVTYKNKNDVSFARKFKL